MLGRCVLVLGLLFLQGASPSPYDDGDDDLALIKDPGVPGSRVPPRFQDTSDERVWNKRDSSPLPMRENTKTSHKELETSTLIQQSASIAAPKVTSHNVGGNPTAGAVAKDTHHHHHHHHHHSSSEKAEKSAEAKKEVEHSHHASIAVAQSAASGTTPKRSLHPVKPIVISSGPKYSRTSIHPLQHQTETLKATVGTVPEPPTQKALSTSQKPSVDKKHLSAVVSTPQTTPESALAKSSNLAVTAPPKISANRVDTIKVETRATVEPVSDSKHQPTSSMRVEDKAPPAERVQLKQNRRQIAEEKKELAEAQSLVQVASPQLVKKVVKSSQVSELHEQLRLLKEEISSLRTTLKKQPQLPQLLQVDTPITQSPKESIAAGEKPNPVAEGQVDHIPAKEKSPTEEKLLAVETPIVVETSPAVDKVPYPTVNVSPPNSAEKNVLPQPEVHKIRGGVEIILPAQDESTPVTIDAAPLNQDVNSLPEEIKIPEESQQQLVQTKPVANSIATIATSEQSNRPSEALTKSTPPQSDMEKIPSHPGTSDPTTATNFVVKRSRDTDEKYSTTVPIPTKKEEDSNSSPEIDPKFSHHHPWTKGKEIVYTRHGWKEGTLVQTQSKVESKDRLNAHSEADMSNTSPGSGLVGLKRLSHRGDKTPVVNNSKEELVKEIPLQSSEKASDPSQPPSKTNASIEEVSSVPSETNTSGPSTTQVKSQVTETPVSSLVTETKSVNLIQQLSPVSTPSSMRGSAVVTSIHIPVSQVAKSSPTLHLSHLPTTKAKDPQMKHKWKRVVAHAA